MIAGIANFIQTFFDKIDSLGLAVVQNIYSSLSQAMSGPFWLAVTVYVAFWGYELTFGRSALTAEQMFTRLARIVVISLIAFNWATFQTVVVNVLTQTSTSVGQAVCQAVATDGPGTQCSASQSLSNVWSIGMNAGNKAAAKGGLTAIGPWFIALLIWGATLLFTALSLGVIAVSKVGLMVLLGLGPFFVAMALFEFSESLARGWAMQCVAFMVVQIFLFGVLGFEMTLMSTVTEQLNAAFQDNTGPNFCAGLGAECWQPPPPAPDTGSNMQVIAPFVLMMLVGLFLTLEAAVIANGIVGGARIGRFRPLGMVWDAAAWAESLAGSPAAGARRTGRVAAAGWRGGAATLRRMRGEGNSMSGGSNAMSAGEAQVRAALERNRQS
jgi:type IV secretion system protein VirB6